MIGIYKITNTVNNKVYIGQSIDIMRRWRQHKQSFESLTGQRKLIQEVKQYGKDNFTFEIIEECKIEELDVKERKYIALFDSYKNGLNMTIGGQSGGHGNSKKISNEELIEIYDLLINSTISQKQIALMYNIGQDTISEINNGKTRCLDGYKFPLRKNNNKITLLKDNQSITINANTICPICGKEKSINAIMCHNCRGIYNRVSDRPDAITLAKEIIELGFSAVGRKYKVTDNAIRKWCKSYSMPTKKKEIVEWLNKLEQC